MDKETAKEFIILVDEEKKKAQDRITRAVSVACYNFKCTTGLSIMGVSVPFINTTSLSDITSVYMPAGARITINYGD